MFLISVVVLLALMYKKVSFSYHQNDNHITYPLDDTYIHMSMAKNMAHHGVWGVTPHAFSSTSSSLLYTFILSVFYLVFGLSEWAPLLLNLVFGVALLYAFWRICDKEAVNPVVSFALLLAVIFMSPLPALIISGMEHTLQLLIDLLFFYYAVKLLLQKDPLAARSYWLLGILTLLTVTIRFEGLFLVAIIGGLFLLRKQFKRALFMGAVAAAPIIFYGLLSVSKGAYFLPNSVLIKGQPIELNLHGVYLLLTMWTGRLFGVLHLLVLFLGLAFYFLYLQAQRRPFWTQDSVWTATLLFLFIIHITFARVGWYERYEAYLVLLAVASVIFMVKGLSFQRLWLNKALLGAAVLVTGLMIFYPLMLRFRRSYAAGPLAMANVYNQQYQMGHFLQRYYNDSTIAANDIGAITYFTNIKLFDMVGLASNEPVALKRSNRFNKEAVRKLIADKQVKVVMIFDDWYKDVIPEEWKKAGEWTEPTNVWVDDSVTVSIYATPFHDVETLKRNLKDFSGKLPKHVVQSGAYITANDSTAGQKISRQEPPVKSGNPPE